MNYREDERPADGFDAMSERMGFLKDWMRRVAGAQNLGLDTRDGLVGEVAFTVRGRGDEPLFDVRCTVSPTGTVAAYRRLDGSRRGHGRAERRFHIPHGDRRAWGAFSAEIRDTALRNRIEREPEAPDVTGLAESIARLVEARPVEAAELLARAIEAQGGRDLVEALKTAVAEAADEPAPTY